MSFLVPDKFKSGEDYRCAQLMIEQYCRANDAELRRALDLLAAEKQKSLELSEFLTQQRDATSLFKDKADMAEFNLELYVARIEAMFTTRLVAEQLIYCFPQLLPADGGKHGSGQGRWRGRGGRGGGQTPSATSLFKNLGSMLATFQPSTGHAFKPEYDWCATCVKDCGAKASNVAKVLLDGIYGSFSEVHHNLPALAGLTGMVSGHHEDDKVGLAKFIFFAAAQVLLGDSPTTDHLVQGVEVVFAKLGRDKAFKPVCIFDKASRRAVKLPKPMVRST
jgi:hypothetical protein